MTRTLHRLAAPLALGLALVGCINGLDEQTLVKSPRILAVVADHPEAAPGQDVHVRVLAFDPMHRELHYTFRACVDTGSFLGSAAANGTAGMAPMQGVCSPWTDPSTNDETTIPGAFTLQLLALVDHIPASSGFDPTLLRNVLASAGLPINVEVHLSVTNPEGTEAVLVSASKQIGITTRERLTTNPPYIYFRVITEPPEQMPDAEPVETTYLGGVDPEHPFDCVPWYSAPATAIASRPGAVADPQHRDERPNHVTFSPADDLSWEESFPIYDFSGMVRTGYEGAYYSWYSTGSLPDRHGVIHSSLHAETTQGPAHGATPSSVDATIRDNQFDIPREPGTYDMWLVVRDGHLGTNACHFTLEVTAPPP